LKDQLAKNERFLEESRQDVLNTKQKLSGTQFFSLSLFFILNLTSFLLVMSLNRTWVSSLCSHSCGRCKQIHRIFHNVEMLTVVNKLLIYPLIN